MILNFKINKTMIHSKLTYYLLTVLCMIATSCVTNGVMDECSDDNINPTVIEGGRVNLILSFPTNSSTRGITGETDGIEKERRINDVKIFTFVDEKFVEEVQYILISGKDGAINRYIEGNLSETYISGKAIDFVIIANAGIKGVTNINMHKEDSKNDLYKQLIYTYDGKDWTENIPMWGEGTISSIQSGTFNIGELTLKRAIAKVNVTVSESVKNFTINKIELHNYHTEGYCAPIEADGQPSIPSSTLSSNPLISTQIVNNKCENQFYIPEHKNIGVGSQQKVYLEIYATVSGVEKTYDISFIENGKAYDILRNYIYVFNITHVNANIESTITYNVEKWENITINVPDFGKE